MTHEKKIYEIKGGTGDIFVKRNITPPEFMFNWKGEIEVPHIAMERVKNEAAAMMYVKEHTNIPVPTIHCAFEDNRRFYIIEDLMPGVSINRLSEPQKAIVMEELEGHIAELHSIASTVMGGFRGVACLPYRVSQAMPKNELVEFKDEVPQELVLCHNDLSQYDVLVDEETLKITGIIDWEYAGFYPKEFEGAFYKRPGPFVALKGEEDDVPKLLSIVDECRKK